MGLCPKLRKLLVRTCLDFFATFLKKGSTKNFHRESFLWIYIVSSTEILRKRVRCNVIFVKCYDSLLLWEKGDRDSGG